MHLLRRKSKVPAMVKRPRPIVPDDGDAHLSLAYTGVNENDSSLYSLGSLLNIKRKIGRPTSLYLELFA